MAKVTQVVLIRSKTFTDNRRKFKQHVPVTLRDPAEVEKYKNNALFAVREIDDGAETAKTAQSQKVNPGDPFAATAGEETTRLPQRKKKSAKKITPKQKE